MIQVDKGKLKFLKAGRAITVDVDREYRKGKAFTVRLEGSKSTKLRCQVLETFQMGDYWRLTIKQDTEEVQWFLAADPGAMRSDYTHDPMRAAKGEPAAVPPTELGRYAEHAHERDMARKRSENADRPRSARIQALERAADAGDHQARRHLFVIDQRIEAAERQRARGAA